MRCLMCGKKLPLLRKLKDPEFCCEAHRHEYAQNREKLALSRLMDTQTKSPVSGNQQKKKESTKKSETRRTSGRLGEFRILNPEKARSAEPEAIRPVAGEPVEVPIPAILPRRERKWLRCRLSHSSLVALSGLEPNSQELTVGIGRSSGGGDSYLAPGFGIAWAGIRSSESWKSAMRPEGDPSRGRTATNTAEWLIPIPLAGTVRWPKPWVESWRGRRHQLTPRAPERRAIALRVDWRPSALPELHLRVEGEDRTQGAGEVEQEARLLRLLPPRARPPKPARLTRPAAGSQAELVQTSWRVQPPFAGLAVTGHRLRNAARVAMSLAQVVEGNRKPAHLEQKAVRTALTPLLPRVESIRVGRKLRPSGRTPVTLPSANCSLGSRVLETDVEYPQPSSVMPAGRTIRPILFTPPEQPILPLRLYPNSMRELEEWRQQGAPLAIEQESSLPPIPACGTKPLCDWVPFMAPQVALSYTFENRVGAREANSGVENLQWECVSSAGPDPKQFRGEEKLTAIPGLGGCATRVFRLSMEGTIARAYKNPPVGQLDSYDIAPVVRLGCSGLKTFAEWLPSSGDEMGGMAWRQPWHAALRTWERLPATPRWLAAAFLAITGAVASWEGVHHRLVPPAAEVASEAAAPVDSQEAPGSAKARPPAARGQVEPEPARAAHAPAVKAGFWNSVQQQIVNRAAISLLDDFRNGLADWEGSGEWAQAWSYDAAGFVRTGPMALYAPTRGLSDYRMEFLGQIERKSLGWVVRAADLKDYYAMKLTILSGGPQPTVALVRTPVIGGVQGAGKRTILPMAVREDTVYRVMTEVHGTHYAVTVQGQMVDSWIEPRLARGGIGLFSGKGEMARIRWVGVWHQYDTLGRLCAFVAPGGLGERTQ